MIPPAAPVLGETRRCFTLRKHRRPIDHYRRGQGRRLALSRVPGVPHKKGEQVVGDSEGRGAAHAAVRESASRYIQDSHDRAECGGVSVGKFFGRGAILFGRRPDENLHGLRLCLVSFVDCFAQRRGSPKRRELPPRIDNVTLSNFSHGQRPRT